MKNFNDFLIEQKTISEVDFKNIVQKGKEKIRDAYDSWVLYLLDLHKKGKLPKGIKVFPYSSNPKLANENFLIENEDISLEHPKPGLMDNIHGSKQLHEVLDDAFTTKKPIMIWGAPGIGKTDIAHQVAKENGVDLVVINLSIREAVDFIGLPHVQEKDGKKTTVFATPGFFPQDNGPGNKGGIIFFDEINRAPVHVANAAMQLILDRKLDQYHLPSQWAIFAAGNRPEDDPSAGELHPAMANRFTHYNYVPTVKDWRAWGSKPKEGEERARIDPSFLAFINFNEKYFHKLNPAMAAGAWPSPRSWAKASDQLRAIEAKRGRNLTEDEIQRIVSGEVGPNAASAYMKFLKVFRNVDLREIDKVYTNPESAVIPEHLSQDDMLQYLQVVAMKRDPVKNPITEEEIKNAYIYAGRFKNKENGFMLLRYIADIHPETYHKKFKTNPKYVPFLQDFMREHGHIFKAVVEPTMRKENYLDDMIRLITISESLIKK